MIKRKAFDRLQYLAEIFPVVGIIGPRQCGKTTLSKIFQQSKEGDFIYLDLEKPDDVNKLSDPQLYLSGIEEKQVIIDEIQRIPEIFPLLRALVDENRRPLRYLILGSASPVLLRQSSESLAGRISYLELGPFNLVETKGVIKPETHFFRGGFPETVLCKSTDQSNEWLDSFISTYLERDLPNLGIAANPLMLRKLLEMLAWSNGDILNYNNLAKSLGFTIPTVKSYIDFLENAFIVRRLYPFHFNIKKRLVKSPKIYIRDSGILHRLLRLQSYDQLLGFPKLGNSWEGFAIEQIYSLKNRDVDMYFFRTHDGAEVDLVFVKALKAIATVEIKFTSTPKTSRGQINCINDMNTSLNFIITPNSDDYLIKDNIRVCNILTFLENYLPKV